MTVQRRYEPEPAALDRVVEILYHLPLEQPDRLGAEEFRSAQAEVSGTSIPSRYKIAKNCKRIRC